jgi:hypothetical protein
LFGWSARRDHFNRGSPKLGDRRERLLDVVYWHKAGIRSERDFRRLLLKVIYFDQTFEG